MTDNNALKALLKLPKEEWDIYADHMFSDKQPSSIQVYETRKAFYAGMWVGLRNTSIGIRAEDADFLFAMEKELHTELKKILEKELEELN